jgi:hypothetical protein
MWPEFYLRRSRPRAALEAMIADAQKITPALRELIQKHGPERVLEYVDSIFCRGSGIKWNDWQCLKATAQAVAREFSTDTKTKTKRSKAK